MLSSAPSPADTADLETGLPSSVLLQPEPPFGDELVARWLAEGDRLDQHPPPPEPPLSPLARWWRRAVEVARPLVEHHRLELLVAAGLLPLMVLLIGQSGGHRRSAPPAATPRIAIAELGAPRLSRSPAPAVAPPAPRPAVQRRKHIVRRSAQAPAQPPRKPPAAAPSLTPRR